ncbi:MAG TPA: DUF177 domain-containing protein [Bryobacteraceae bacterium]|nr:DUF177 domain-containing protein [Bryobacteraceae bacterium]
MFLNVREMELRKVRFDQTFPPGEIQFLDGELRQAGPLHAVGSAELLPNTGGEIRILGHLDVRMQSECDRCLEVAEYPVALEFDLFYEPAVAEPAGQEVALKAKDSEVDFYQGEGLELEDVLREQILLSLPMQRTCREDCRGICPVCGTNRNRAECGCQVSTPDDRWAALRDM